MSEHFHSPLTESTSITVLFPWGALVIDKKTGKVKRVVPEKTPPGGWHAALEGGAAFLRGTEGFQGVEELRLHAAKFLVSQVETVMTEVRDKVASQKAIKPSPDPFQGMLFAISDLQAWKPSPDPYKPSPDPLKPSPDPWRDNVLVITNHGTMTVVTKGFALVINRITSQINKVVPEMVIPGEYGYAVEAAVALLLNTENLKGVEELRLQTANFLTSMTEKMAAKIATQTT